MIKPNNKSNKLNLIICLICFIGSYPQPAITYFRGPIIPSFSQNYLSYQNIPSVEEVNFCDFLMYADNMGMRLLRKRIFGFLPEHIPHLPLSYSEEDFPINYWIHEDIPEAQRYLIYQVVGEVNMELGFRAFVIAGIDSNQIDSIGNRKDQRNVIYWLDREEISALVSHLTYYSSEVIASRIPAITIQTPNPNILDLSFYPIFDADIVINIDFITDLKVFQSYLIVKLKEFGVEDIPLNVNVRYLYNLLIQRLASITLEEYQEMLINNLTQELQTTELYSNAVRNEIDLTEEEEENFNQSSAGINREISHITSADIAELFRSIILHRGRFTFIDVDRFQNSSSVFFKTSLKHELLHVLGLDHYTGIINSDTKPLMGGDVGFEDILTSRQVDDYAEKSLSCIYDLDSLRQRLPLE